MKQYVVLCNFSDNTPAANSVPFAAMVYEDGKISAYGSDEFVNEWRTLLQTNAKTVEYLSEPDSFSRLFGGTYSANMIFSEESDLTLFNEKVKELGFKPQVIFEPNPATGSLSQWDGVARIKSVRIV